MQDLTIHSDSNNQLVPCLRLIAVGNESCILHFPFTFNPSVFVGQIYSAFRISLTREVYTVYTLFIV